MRQRASDGVHGAGRKFSWGRVRSLYTLLSVTSASLKQSEGNQLKINEHRLHEDEERGGRGEVERKKIATLYAIIKAGTIFL